MTRGSDGTSHLVFTPQAFLTRLSWLIAQPHIHLIRYHGVLAPNHAWRSEIVLRKPPEEELSEGAAKPAGPAKGTSWAELLRRVFAVEVLVCRFCGGERRIIAEVEEGPIARKILAHLGLPATAPKPAQGKLFSTGLPPVDEPEATVQWSPRGPVHPERAQRVEGPASPRLRLVRLRTLVMTSQSGLHSWGGQVCLLFGPGEFFDSERPPRAADHVGPSRSLKFLSAPPRRSLAKFEVSIRLSAIRIRAARSRNQ